MDYKPRLNCPEDGNKYYNRKINGGYSTCVQGNTKMSCYDPKLDVLPNCVGYAMGRFNEIGEYNYFKYTFIGNAEDWYAYAIKIGLETGLVPKLGSVICWRSGKAGISTDGCGHVAVVEQINKDGSIVTSESGWSVNKLFWTTSRKKGSNNNWGMNSNYYVFQGFIYNPAVQDTDRTLKRGDTGSDVKKLQSDLNKFGWYDLTEDGIFGVGTEKAVKDFQKKLDLVVDGIFGPISKETLANQIKLPDGAKNISILVDGKDRSMFGINLNGQNYVRLVDIYYQLNLAEVGYNKNKKKPYLLKK